MRNHRRLEYERVNPYSKVKVVHVVETLELGGLERLLVDFVRHIDLTRFSPQVITLGRRGLLADEIESTGCPVTSLGIGPGLTARVWAVPKLASYFRRERVDVVHTHSEGPLIFGAPAAKLAGVPRVVHTRHHGPDLGSSRHAIAAMARVSRWVDKIACVADDGARWCITEGVEPGKIVTIWNGIDLDRFKYTGPIPRGPAVIVARLIPEKDHTTLLHALAIASKEEPDLRLEVAGEGPCLEELQGIARRLDVAKCTTFLGRIDDVPALLSRAGLLVLSSRLEGISLTLLEAMAAGLPVVATRVGGNPEVVIDGQTGRLVPSQSPADLASAILEVWRDPERSRTMGLAGRARAEECFDVRKTVARYEELYCVRPPAKLMRGDRVVAGVIPR